MFKEFFKKIAALWVLLGISGIYGQSATLAYLSPDPIFLGQEEWSKHAISRPMVIRSDSTHWIMYYYAAGEFFQIGRAISNDGMHWQTEPEVPVLTVGQQSDWDSEGVAYPYVLVQNGIFRLWYTGVDRFGNKQIGYAESNDGIHWIKSRENPIIKISDTKWFKNRVSYPSVLEHDRTYLMWFTAGSMDTSQIGFGQSQDGIHWQIQDKPVLEPNLSDSEAFDHNRVSGPTVQFANGLYHMLYVGTRIYNEYRAIGHAFSFDGIRWFRDKSSPWILMGDPGVWAAQSASCPFFLVQRDIFKIWFSGQSYKDITGIGFAKVIYSNIY